MSATLADLLPAVAVALGDPAAAPHPPGIELAPNRDFVVLLIDGLGAELLARHARAAPTLAGLSRGPIVAGFPATTVSSLSSLAMGAPCAVHGLIGYSFAIPGASGPQRFNALRWRVDGADARQLLPPERVQLRTSRLERMAAAGIEVHYVVPAYQMRSGLTRAAFRAPGILHPAKDLSALREGIMDLARHRDSGGRFGYAYHPDLDAIGHHHGPGSAQWLTELGRVDALVAELLTALPATCTLIVTGDHGMIRADAVIDLESPRSLRTGVRMIAGEARVRHVYLDDPRAAGGALARWSGELAGHARVVTREQALDEHWFGATPPEPVIAHRIGDLIAVAEGSSVLALPQTEPAETAMAGHHGAFTADEQLVPLIVGRTGAQFTGR